MRWTALFPRRLALCLLVTVGSVALAQRAEPRTPQALVQGRDITACAFSADGSAILFSWKRDGGQIRRLALSQVIEAGPAKADEAELVTPGLNPLPFGEQLLFVRRGSEQGGLWTRSLTTGEERQVRKDPFLGLPPAVSGDGSVIMVCRWAGKSGRIGRVDPQTGKYTSLPGTDMTQPALNAAGDRLLFVRANQVWLRDLETNDDTQLTHGELACSWPTWNPMGDRIAFCAKAREGACKIGLLDLQTGTTTWLVEALEAAACPAFSPDGKWLIYLCRTADGYDTLICRVAASLRDAK